jgi:hypothetical protein
MNKKFTSGIAIVLFAIALCLNLFVNPNLDKGNAMTLSMKNIEALADDESGVQYRCLTNSEHCVFIYQNGMIVQIRGILV